MMEKRVLFAPLFNSSKYGICIVSLDGIIITKNNAFCDTFGLHKNAIEGLTLHDIFPDQTHRIIAITFGLFIKQSLEGSGEWILTHLVNNSKKHIEYHFQLFQPDGDEKCVALYVNDITAKTESELKLKQQYEVIKEYASFNSHHTRSHVARILGLSMLFNPNNLSDQNNLTIIKYIQEEAMKLDEVIHFIAQKTSSAQSDSL
jgi:PAS domain S-box-containing protein